MEQENNTDIPAKETAENNPGTQAGKNNDAKIPTPRFNEVVSERNVLREQVAELKDKFSKVEADQKKAHETGLKEKEEYKILYEEQGTELDKYKTKAEAWDTYEADRRKALIGKLPENRQEFGADMSLAKLEKFTEQELTAPPKTNAGRPGNASAEFGGYSSLEEFAIKDPIGCEKYLQQSTPGYIR